MKKFSLRLITRDYLATQFQRNPAQMQEIVMLVADGKHPDLAPIDLDQDIRCAVRRMDEVGDSDPLKFAILERFLTILSRSKSSAHKSHS